MDDRRSAVAVIAVRTSEADGRERHPGVSHHARRSSTSSAVGAVLAAAADAGEGSGRRRPAQGCRSAHMGRDPADDPAFFRAAYAAGLGAPPRR